MKRPGLPAWLALRVAAFERLLDAGADRGDLEAAAPETATLAGIAATGYAVDDALEVTVQVRAFAGSYGESGPFRVRGWKRDGAPFSHDAELHELRPASDREIARFKRFRKRVKSEREKAEKAAARAARPMERALREREREEDRQRRDWIARRDYRPTEEDAIARAAAS